MSQQRCRWLLMSLDRLPSNQLVMLQDLITNMRGVRMAWLDRHENLTISTSHMFGSERTTWLALAQYVHNGTRGAYT